MIRYLCKSLQKEKEEKVKQISFEGLGKDISFLINLYISPLPFLKEIINIRKEFDKKFEYKHESDGRISHLSCRILFEGGLFSVVKIYDGRGITLSKRDIRIYTCWNGDLGMNIEQHNITMKMWDECRFCKNWYGGVNQVVCKHD